MNSRLKQIRIALDLSQEEFGKKIGIKSRAHISALENGSRNITDRIISDVCEKYNVNIKWLKSGEGDMFIKRLPEDELSAYLGEILNGDDEYIKKYILTYMKLKEEQKQVLRDFAKTMAEK